MVSWHSDDAAGSHIQAQLVDATGTSLGNQIDVADLAAGEAGLSAVVMNGSGSFNIAYSYTDFTNLTGSYIELDRYTPPLPVAIAAGPSSGVPGQQLTFDLMATSLLPEDQAAGYLYTIAWGDGTTSQVGPLAGDGSGVTASHTYANAGSFSVTLTATDQHGSTSQPFILPVDIQQVVQEGDNLVVGGNSGNQSIDLTKGSVIVTIDGQRIGEYEVGGSVSVYAGAGNVSVQVDPQITLPLTLVAGSGNDTLEGGGGLNTFVGGSGNDTFIGGPGVNIVEGGTGSNTFVSGGGINSFVAPAGSNAPIGFSDQYQATANTPLSIASPGVLAADVSPDGSALTAVLDSQPSHGSVTLNPDGSFTYTPAPGFTGDDEFTYQAIDGSGVLSAPTEVTIQVQGSAAAFLIQGIPASIPAGASFSVSVVALDAGGNVAVGYAGTVHFASTDSLASLPANYTFTAADAGSHTFMVTFSSPGFESLTVSDADVPGIITTYSGIAVEPNVTNTADSGPGSLRQAILDANANPGVGRIVFTILSSTPVLIQPLSPLPAITEPVIVDATTEPGLFRQPVGPARRQPRGRERRRARYPGG